MKPSEILEQYGWTQGYFARDKSGMTMPSMSPYATCFCAVGAIKRSDFPTGSSLDVLREHIGAASVEDVYRWNDAPGRTKDEVIAVLKACGL